jgi:hypothetical protein
VNTQEREFVLDRLRKSRERFLCALEGLSAEQQTFRPAEDRWSIADCAEHVGIAEDLVYQRIQQALQEPPAPERQAEVQGKTDFMLQFVPDRGTRVKGPERVMPRREWRDFSDLIATFDAARNRTIDFASQTAADLHNHFYPHPIFKELDCYQWLVFNALHAERHVLQMEEVMTAPGYPQKVAGQSV